RDWSVTGVQTCALPILAGVGWHRSRNPVGTTREEDRMPLDAYRRPRMIVLNPSATAHEAACAMAANGVGAVLVADARKLVGVVRSEERRVGKEGGSGRG